jgi:hypothetical protein
MPTNTDSIRALEKSEAELRTRVQSLETVRGDLRLLAEEVTRLSRLQADETIRMTREMATVQEKVANHEKLLDRTVHQRFTIVVALISAFVGGLLTFLAQISLKYLAK